jgi:hypothetical protein
MDCKVKLMRLFISILLLFWFASVNAADVPDPKIVKRNGVKTLLLPDSFIQKVSTDYPGFRIPTRDDLTGFWSHWEDRMGGFPYICWGDFNGDGLIDVATFLLSDNGWKFVVYHKSSQGYVRVLYMERNSGRPDDVVLATVPKGEAKIFEGYDPFKDTIERIVKTYMFDAIEYLEVERNVRMIYWENGDYRFGLFGSD